MATAGALTLLLATPAEGDAAYSSSDPAEEAIVGVISDLEPSAAGERAQKKATSEDNDIPLDGFVIALAIAALIGAAGGFVYAGIMGPKR